MGRPDDIPDFLFPKPWELEQLELLPPEIIHAMTRVAMEEKIHDVAVTMAKLYMLHTPPSKASFDECSTLVSMVLKETGGSIPGQLGALMVGTCQQVAEDVSRDYFPDDTLRHG
ncbi:MAG: hypothetical protein LLG04_17045 [Parachlamydia sp.]|nr:hypothetical protein [Parachlamydia sp.]